MKKAIHFFLLIFSTCTLAQDLESGLVAKYLFSDNFADSSSTANDLELYNEAYPMTFGKDRHGNDNSALEIPANANDIKFLVTKNINTAYDFDNEFSISYWINFSSYVPDGYIIYGGNPNGSDIDFGLTTNSGYVYYKSDAFWDVQVHSGSIDGEFIHTVFTYKDGLLSAYINGTKSFFEYSVDYLNSTTNKLVIGKFSDTGFGNGGYVGYLDDIHLYNRAISEDEIALLYGDQTVGKEESTIKKLSISPNPSSTHLNLSMEAETVEIYSTNGQLIKSYKNKKTIDVLELPKGFYFLKAKSNNNFYTGKFIKK